MSLKIPYSVRALGNSLFYPQLSRSDVIVRYVTTARRKKPRFFAAQDTHRADWAVFARCQIRLVGMDKLPRTGNFDGVVRNGPHTRGPSYLKRA